MTAWGFFFLYATHFPQEMFRPPEKENKLEKKKTLHRICLIFFWLLFCKRTNANIIHEALCRRERRRTKSQAAHRWVTHCSHSITLPRLGWETLRILMYVKPPPGSDAARPCSKVTKCKLCYGASVWNQLIIEIEKEEWGRGWVGGGDSVLEKSGSWISNAIFFFSRRMRFKWRRFEYSKSGYADPQASRFHICMREFSRWARARVCRRAPVCKRKVIQGASGQFPSTCFSGNMIGCTSLFLNKQKAQTSRRRNIIHCSSFLIYCTQENTFAPGAWNFICLIIIYT